MRSSARILLAGFATTLAVAGASCSSCTRSAGSSTAREDVALIPKEAAVLGMVNVARMRDTAFWRKMLDLRDQNAVEKKKSLEELKKSIPEADRKDPSAPDDGAPKDFEEFVARCGFDPFKQLDSVFVALPSAMGEGEFGVIAHGTFDETKLVGCARAMVKKEGGELLESEYAGKKLYNDSSSGAMTIAFLDGKTMVIAGREWVKKILDLAGNKGGENAKSNEALAQLMKQARTSDAMWGIGVVSDKVREQLKNDDKLKSAGSLKSLFGSIDFPSGMTLLATFELGSNADATDLAKTIGEQLVEMKKNGKVMMLGLSSYIDAIKVEAVGSSFKISAKLNQQQVDELVSRVQGMAKGLGGAGGGMLGMPGAQ